MYLNKFGKLRNRVARSLGFQSCFCDDGLKLISVNDYGNPLLPFNDRHDIDCRRDPRESGLGCFLAGDVRANEQVG